MNQEKHGAAMQALNELILSELQSDDRRRFASVQRLSVIAQKLLHCNTDTLRPEDARIRHHQFGGYGAVQIGDDAGDDIAMANPYVMQMQPPNDQAQIVREMLAALNPMAKSNQEHSAAKTRESLARELNELTLARGRLGLAERGPVAERIEEILKEMREGKGDEDELSLVPAVAVRGHQVGARLDGDDEDDLERARADGEGRASGIVPAGERERFGETLGDGRGADEDRSRLDVGADPDARCNDCAGAALPTEAPEAAP